MWNNWYYAIVGVVTLIIAWTVILWPGAPNFKGFHLWSFSTPGIIPFVVWSLIFALFTWGMYHIDNDESEESDTNVLIFRSLYLVICLVTVVMFVLFFAFHNFGKALVATIFMLVLIIGLIMLISERHLYDAWFVFVYFLWLVYQIYYCYYASNHNNNVENEYFI